MKLFDNDIVLPGVVTEVISDYSVGYDTSLFGTTDSVAIVGTAFDGPVGRPVRVYSPEHARYMFGGTYDSKTRREATLVANIEDAWARGCRTIYAVRISGKPIFKDYQFAIDTNLKLRVSGRFPSNANKDLCFVYEDRDDIANVTIFKPSDRATINEKNQGLVDSQFSILENRIDLVGGGITKNDDLIDLITRVNQNPFNNVINLSIVDDKGNDVTLSSTEAKGIKVGDMFPGIYTIGRLANVEGVKADTKIDLVMDAKPYSDFDGNFYKKLVANTNVSKDLPIYDANGRINDLLGISAINQYDFLGIKGKIDTVFLKDAVDYEEVDLDNFDLYKKLGSGYAINAMVHKDAKSSRFKVKEVTDKDMRISAIKDGLYSMLENLDAKYRVIAGINADTKIKGKLPKAEDFKVAQSLSLPLMNKSVELKAVVNKHDLTEPKSYKVTFAEMTGDLETELDTVKEKTLINKTVREATLRTFEQLQAEEKALKRDRKVYKEGSLFLVTGVTSESFSEAQNLLYIFSNGKFQSLHGFVSDIKDDILKDSLILCDGKLYACTKNVQKTDNNLLSMSTFQFAVEADITDGTEKSYIVVALDNGTFVVGKVSKAVAKEEAGAMTVEILGTISQVFSEEEDKLLVSLTSTYGTNDIKIVSNQFDFLTVDEVITLLNKDKDFAKLFKFEITNITDAQEYVKDIIDKAVSESITGTLVDKKVDCDTNMVIPFRTDDNFARQLAQHCTYTSLKTAPTHGLMGVSILLDTNLDSISNKVEELVSLRLESLLVAKKDKGTNLLDRNNMPYPIGRKISIIVGQYPVTTDDNYTYVSNMSAGYAGMISTLPLDQSSTCQPIDIPTPMYELTNYQLGALTQSGFVTVKQSYSKGWVITDGITMAPAGSEYKRLSASRITDGVEEIIRRVAEPFIGKQNNLTNQNSLRAAIKSELDKIKDKLIAGYDFKLITDKQIERLGRIDIDFKILPIYEIKEVRASITVSDK